MKNNTEKVQQLLDSNLNSEHQAWLLGAGISKEAGIPLMGPLTERVRSILEDFDQDNKDANHSELYSLISGTLTEGHNVEDILSQIGDYIAITKRRDPKEISVGGRTLTIDHLQELHHHIQEAISRTIKYGYLPCENGNGEKIGDQRKSIININYHIKFIEALFKKRFSGRLSRKPIKFFTTNYDTLLEDALSLKGLSIVDGFKGGAVAYWDPEVYENPNADAEVFKLHGSIDWFKTEEQLLIRKRDGAPYPDEETSQLLIYPQATKYKLTQRDPFAQLFEKFRRTLISDQLKLFGICGYSFNDKHINEEIASAMAQTNDSITMLALVKELNGKLPDCLESWLDSEEHSWTDRLLIVTDNGFYDGSKENILENTETYDWWTYQGLIKVLNQGAEVML